MDDIRIKFTLPHHPKFKKLKMIIGDGAFEHLARLWISAAQNNPKGNLAELDDMDIAIYAGWEGDPLKFVNALKSCKFIADNGNGLEIQDWREHQPFAYYSQERSEIAKKNISKRWKKEGTVKGSNTDSIQTVYQADTPSPIPTPIPTPKDSPKKKGIIFSEDSDEFKLSNLLLTNIITNKPKFKLPDLQKWCVPIGRAMRLDNRTEDELRKVINWCQQDNFWSNNILSTAKLREQFDQLWGKMTQPPKKKALNPDQDPGFPVYENKF